MNTNDVPTDKLLHREELLKLFCPTDDPDKFGLAVVIDQDGDAWDVEPEDIWLDDTDAWDVELDDEHDQFRTDAEADQDALDSVYGADDDGCTCLGDD